MVLSFSHGPTGQWHADYAAAHHSADEAEPSGDYSKDDGFIFILHGVILHGVILHGFILHGFINIQESE